MPPSATALAAYVELLDGTGLPWAASAVGADLVRSELCGAALDAGGHLHVGLEFFAGERTPTNLELVTEAVEATAAAGRRWPPAPKPRHYSAYHGPWNRCRVNHCGFEIGCRTMIRESWRNELRSGDPGRLDR
ncbi:3-keto-5-aminohexanoate cleavage protein [Mycobacterium nebraskense]|nr:3-keto-5-aminohexanoate cleavage protein [Mycobacterium nebraskense]